MAATSTRRVRRSSWRRSSSSRTRSLYETRAVPLRDLQQSQAAALAAQNDLRSAQTSLEVMRNRLRILGLTDEEITTFGETGDDQPADDDLFADRRHGHSAQGRARTIRQHLVEQSERERSDLRYRRPVHGLAGGLCARIRSAECPNRASGALHRTGLSEPRVHREYRLCRNIARPRHPSPAGARDHRQFAKALLRPEMFASVTILTGEGDSSLGGAARCDHL